MPVCVALLSPLVCGAALPSTITEVPPGLLPSGEASSWSPSVAMLDYTPTFANEALKRSGATLRSKEEDSIVLAVSAARHQAWYAAWAAGHGLPTTAVLNTGASADDDDDMPTPQEDEDAAQALLLLQRILRHVCGPLLCTPGASSDGPRPCLPLAAKEEEEEEDPSSSITMKGFVQRREGLAQRVFPLRIAVAGDVAQPPLVATDEAMALGPVFLAELTACLRRARAVLREAVNRVSAGSSSSAASSVDARCYARVGLVGNPSDMLHGKTLSATVANFWARVRISAVAPPNSGRVVVLPHPIADRAAFSSLADVSEHLSRNGYSGGQRLIFAALKRFNQYAGITTSGSLATKGFTLEYDTNVPRQVGLAGSSCIVAAVFKALAAFYQVPLDLHTAPSAVLAVEKEELGIHAGLQDRVAQVWGGLVAMDFARDHLEATGHGRYARYPVDVLPTMYLAYAMDPSDSGRMHANVNQRYASGDAQVVEASKQWAGLVDAAVQCLIGRAPRPVEEESETQTTAAARQTVFADLVDKNFALRRSVYGVECLGWKNVHMVEIARRHGAAAKFPGSGGAILVVPRPECTDARLAAMDAEMQLNGYVLVRLHPTENDPAG